MEVRANETFIHFLLNLFYVHDLNRAPLSRKQGIKMSARFTFLNQAFPRSAHRESGTRPFKSGAQADFEEV